jgi:diguanylate cyclase (GGDEF)-like protein
MFSVGKFSCVVAAFVLAVSAVVWTAVGEERGAGRRAFDKIENAEAMLDAVLARESALRGYGQTRRRSFLEPYDESTATLAAAADRARAFAHGKPAELAAIAEQQRLAERWAGSANDAIILMRNRRPLTSEATLVRSDLINRFTLENQELRGLIDQESAAAHRSVLERAVLLITLLTGAFAAAAGLLTRRLRRRDEERRSTAERYHATQREFSETLQVTESEAEAHALVKRHLERSLPDSEVVVLNRNNSQNRLEATTQVEEGSSFALKLVDSAPNSCLAVRLGRTHAQSAEHEPLLACGLCGELTRSTCVPSLVGGEVIGSVLVDHPRPLGASELDRIVESVSQAAPVLANLRNLAVAEIRAATDGLTGLPNARAVREDLKRMVAQAARSELPLAAVLCDLDHFKQINDVYGHSKGDEVLAAAGAAMRAGLRESDLVGRYGGEEFLILLPDTELEGALVLAQKLCDEIARIEIPGVDRTITASFGVAAFPADAPDGDMLVRMADRALYAAKARGRNCIVAAAELLARKTVEQPV